MPLHSENRMFPDALPWPFHPCRAVDGLGREIEDCVAVNTLTGECWRVIKDGNGEPVKDLARKTLKVLLVQAPLPIRFLPGRKEGGG